MRRCAPNKGPIMLPDQQRNERTPMKCVLPGRIEAVFDNPDLFNDYVMGYCDRA